MTDFKDIDIFDPIYLYPSETRDKEPKPRKKLPHEMSAAERRQHYNKKAEEKAIRQRVNLIRATDSYVKSLEEEVVQARTYLSIKNLKEDFNTFNNQYGVKPSEKENSKEKDTKKEK